MGACLSVSQGSRYGTLKRWGPPRLQGLCSHLAHLGATSDSAPCSEAVGIPQAAGVM